MLTPTNGRILVKLTPEDYNLFITDPNVNLFRGSIYSISEGSFSETPVSTDGQGSFSWVRRPLDSNLKSGNIILFVRDPVCVPSMIKNDFPANPTKEIIDSENSEELLHLVLIEESHVFGLVN